MLEELAPIRQEFERSLRDMAILEWQLSASDKVVASAQAELDSVASQLCLAPGASVEESLERRPSGALSAAISLHGDASSSSAAEIRAPLDPVLALERCSREVARLKGAIRRILPQFAALQTRLRVLLDGQRRAVPRAAHDAALQELARRAADAPRIARLAGGRIPREWLERETPDEVDRHVGDLPAIVASFS